MELEVNIFTDDKTVTAYFYSNVFKITKELYPESEGTYFDVVECDHFNILELQDSTEEEKQIIEQYAKENYANICDSLALEYKSKYL